MTVLLAGKCSGSVLADNTCVVKPTNSLTGPLDLCTVEGITALSGGRLSLPEVFTGQGVIVTDERTWAHAGPAKHHLCQGCLYVQYWLIAVGKRQES
jgi:hypothetical protein